MGIVPIKVLYYYYYYFPQTIHKAYQFTYTVAYLSNEVRVRQKHLPHDKDDAKNSCSMMTKGGAGRGRLLLVDAGFCIAVISLCRKTKQSWKLMLVLSAVCKL